MKRVFALTLLTGVCLFARSAETIYFRAIMLPSNEVPAIDIAANGVATLRAHVVRDDNGQITEGSVDFLVDYAFPAGQTFTGLHIHNGAAGVNGPVIINTGLSAANPVIDSTGRGSIDRQAQVRSTDTAGVATLRGMVDNPSAYYANLHTTENPGGVIRGQLQRASTAVFVGMMNPGNEVPAIDLNASGVSHVLVITTRDASGALTSGQMIFDVNYNFPGQVTFTGFHIHTGEAGTNGPVIFNTGIGAGAASVQGNASGTGNIHRPVEVNVTQAVQVQALEQLLATPSQLYINLHTTDFPGGVIRSQMRRTDRMTFNVTMSPANEVPAIALDASAQADVNIYTVRYEDGNVQAGAVEFDSNFRFPGEVEFTGFHIHDGAAGANGPVTINTGLSGVNSVKTDTGFGNVYRMVTVGDAAGLATLNSLVVNPENHYVNLHSTVNPGGIVRSQLAPANTAQPVIRSVVPANLDGSSTTLAPGGLITFFGTNLAKTTTDLSGWAGSSIPDILNGVAVAVGGQRARLLYVSPTQINAQLAVDTPTGQQPAAVNNGNGPGAPAPVTVAAMAPAIFVGSTGGIVVKASDFSLVGPGNAARAGDVVVIYATGLGQTTPALVTGRIVPATPLSNTAAVTVTIGGQNAEVIGSVAAPGFVGLYQIAVRVPAGLAAGSAPLVVRAAQAASNSVTIAVQ